MSSLAFDDVQEESYISGFPELHVIDSRSGLRNRSCSSSAATHVDEVVLIGGRITISF